MTKNCAYCGAAFDAKSPTAMYCSELHRNYAFRKNNPGYRRKKAMGGIDQPALVNAQATSTQIIPVEKFNRISQQLDPASQMVFELLKEQNADLRTELKTKIKEHADEVKALKEKIETLTREKSEMEKSRDEAQRNLDAKPTGLAGLVQTQPDLLKEFMPVLAGLAEKVLKPTEPVPPFVQWLKMQPSKFQEDFMAMVGAIMQDSQRLEVINRSLMSASSPEQHQASGSSRYS